MDFAHFWFGGGSAIIATIFAADNYTATNEQVNTQSLFDANVWTSNVTKIVEIEPGAIVGSASTGVYAFNIPTGWGGSLIINNAGSIQGAGGAANSGTGGNAVNIAANNGLLVEFNNVGAIQAGGGGGGKGGTGGKGGNGSIQTWVNFGDSNVYCRYSQHHDYYRVACNTTYNRTDMRCSGQQKYINSDPNCSNSGSGSVGQYCLGTAMGGYRACEAPTGTSTTQGGAGGAGGNGGLGQGYNRAATSGSGGAAGANGGENAGRGGTGGTGGTGGAFGAAGGTGNTGATGANGNASSGLAGSAGSAGGAPGYYIIGSGNYTMNNTGTLSGLI